MGCASSIELAPASIYADAMKVGTREGIVWKEAKYKFKEAEGGRLSESKLIDPISSYRNVVSWLPAADKDIVGIVLIAHGLHAHAQAHKKEGIAFAKAGFATYAIDHLGHGISSGERARINNWQEVCNDYMTFAASMQENHPAGTPVILYGHSMGTLITAHAAAGIANVKAVIFSGFPLKAGPGAASIFGCRCLYPVSQLSFVAKIGACLACVDPKGPTAPLILEAITNNEEALADIRKDPRRYHGWLMNVTGARLLEMIDELKFGTVLQSIRQPCYLVHGADDEIAYPEGSTMAYANLGTEAGKKTLEILPGIKHEYYAEVDSVSDPLVAKVVAYAINQVSSTLDSGLPVTAISVELSTRRLVLAEEEKK